MKTTNRHRILLIVILILSSGLLQAKSIDTFSIQFSFNDLVVSETSKNYIDSLVKEKILIPGRKLTILGYADYVGGNKYNYTLSQSRANNVMEYLISSGFGKSDVKVCLGKGKIERMSTKNEGYAGDRKVQIIIEKLQEAARVKNAAKSVSVVSLSDITTATENDLIPLDNVLFENGSHEILKSSLHDLILLVKFLKTNPSIAVQVEGHICCGGWTGGSSDPDTGVNGMSGKRAKAVNDILVLNGIAQARIKYIGLGTSKPFVSPERTPADEALNRRVAIRILSK